MMKAQLEDCRERARPPSEPSAAEERRLSEHLTPERDHDREFGLVHGDPKW
jgi:hypothetical protein